MPNRSVGLTRRSLLEGKKIARVELERGVSDQSGAHYVEIRSIEFTNGDVLHFRVIETGCDYAVLGTVVKP
jgi:hypothetical protein